MVLLTAPQPGDWFVTSDGPINSTLTGSVASNVIQWATNSPFNHAGICVTPGWVVEAQPHGARQTSIGGYLGPNTTWSNGYGLTSEDDRGKVTRAATGLLGTPYGWPDIAAVALAQRKMKRLYLIDPSMPMARQPWWVQRLANPAWLICSQLVDYAFLKCDRHLFTDGRPEGLVAPGDLGRLLGA